MKTLVHLQPFHLELNFFNKENRVLHYPVRAFIVDGIHLMAYNICSGADSIYKKLYTTVMSSHDQCGPLKKQKCISVMSCIFLLAFMRIPFWWC